MKRTEKNIEKLAGDVLDGWDMDTLQCYALDRLIEAYTENKQLFNDDVELMYN